MADVSNVIAIALHGKVCSQMVEGEKMFDITLRWPLTKRQDPISIGEIPVDVSARPADEKPAAPRLRLKDLEVGGPDTRANFVRPGVDTIYREQGKRLVAVRFRVAEASAANLITQARRTVAALVQAPYRVEWSSR
jgi:cobalt-zinc-cadmium resistance protein CzcA